MKWRLRTKPLRTLVGKKNIKFGDFSACQKSNFCDRPNICLKIVIHLCHFFMHSHCFWLFLLGKLCCCSFDWLLWHDATYHGFLQERCPPLIEDFLYICDDAYRRSEFLEMERMVLKTIGFDIGMPLSYRFLRRYAKVRGRAALTVLDDWD